MVCDINSDMRVDQQHLTKQSYLKAALIQLVFLSNLSYHFCPLFKSPTGRHSLKSVAIDYD
jgi:hypothetical protein